ncbi:histidine kinase N-terminal 7TM domain-containing protein [Alkaliphilus peptidifermentans]|uniref:Two-component system, LytT family, sensor kinase n=1 Tax=Alkaliphilus peptidifermentans DSM 18978 TaxID=1120976 RepID=A0A1G5FE76_9FIRM|nr:histidine kinase N-terminal 7TM domain-containing protein [Alkaliphilus peptidifermentans]SCY37477.1 two-component system, LytT family, sensor kinase [Alkaliphilus peptidifermentans DSM 18978]
MNVVRLAFTLVLAASVFCAILLINYAYKKRSIPGANYFILLLITAIIYNLTYIGEINSNNLATAMFWFNLQHIPIPFQHYLWMMLSLEYSKATNKQLKIAKYLGLYHPISFILIYFTNNLHNLYISSYRFESNGYFPVIFSDKGPLFFLMVISGTLLGIISMTFYVRGVIKSSRLHKYGYFIMIFTSLFPWFTVYLNAANKNYLGIDYFPVVSIFSGILYMFGIFKFRIFNTIPIATEIVFRQSKEGVMVIDLTNHIVDANNTFINIYPELKELPHKYTLDSFIEKHPELNGIYGEDSTFKYKLEKDGTERHYSAEITKIVLEDGFEIGKIVTINDITIFVENEKNLKYIATTALDKAETNEMSFLQAQIKPHFLNNTLSVIGAMVTRDPNGAKKLIENLGEYLANCCYFDNTTPMVLLEEEIEAVNTYIAIEKTRFGDRLQFDIIYDTMPKINIPRLILQPLVENSIRHGILRKADGGNVWLIITNEETKISFEIKDNGVGISEEKLLQIRMGEGNNQGIGILNIHRRLIKHYGDGLKIDSKKGSFTSVKFSIPFHGKSQLESFNTVKF